MTPTLKIILLLGAILWGLASLILLVALFRAASRPTPETNLTEPWQPTRRMRKNRNQADELHSLRT